MRSVERTINGADGSGSQYVGWQLRILKRQQHARFVCAARSSARQHNCNAAGESRPPFGRARWQYVAELRPLRFEHWLTLPPADLSEAYRRGAWQRWLLQFRNWYVDVAGRTRRRILASVQCLTWVKWPSEILTYSEVFMATLTKPEAALTVAQQPTPALFFETMNAYQRTEALKAAIELGVFTAIGKGE